MQEYAWLIQIAAVIVVLIGLAGAVLPVLPGLPLVFGGLWLIAWGDDYARVGSVTLIGLGVLTGLGLLLDFIVASLGAQRVGASPQAITGATLGTLVGLFFGLPGLILGPFIGAVLGELKARRGLEQAAASGVGTWVGLLLGTVAKLAIALTMIAVFAFAWFV
ncbi:MAG TPA: DUF456 family protein [Nevskiaceae bacterium]|nr:DUF456 family protein [Nevskiaceae bacterium]